MKRGSVANTEKWKLDDALELMFSPRLTKYPNLKIDTFIDISLFGPSFIIFKGPS